MQVLKEKQVTLFFSKRQWQQTHTITTTEDGYAPNFRSKYRKYPSTPASPAPTETGRQAAAGAYFATTGHSTRRIATEKAR